MLHRLPRSPRDDTCFPYPTLVRSPRSGRIKTSRTFSSPTSGRPTRKSPTRSPAPSTATCSSRATLTSTKGTSIGRRSRRSEEHTSELQSLMRISYAVFCLKTKKTKYNTTTQRQINHKIARNKHINRVHAKTANQYTDNLE